MAEERVQRRLAAILAADVAGYSRLMGSDDEGTFASLKACRELIALKSKQHRGRTVNTPGDSVLVEFASAVDAARCAIEIQKEMAQLNAVISEDRRLEFRIGINVGDIIVDEGDTHLGLALCFLGRSQEALVELDTANRLSPRDFQAGLNNIGRAIACLSTNDIAMGSVSRGRLSAKALILPGPIIWLWSTAPWPVKWRRQRWHSKP